MQASHAAVPSDPAIHDDIHHRLTTADATIRHHMYAAMGVGLIPIPVADFVALTAVQLDMIRRLSHIYNQPFFEDKVKKIIATLTGTVLPMGLARPVFGIIKMIPVVGYAASILVMPALAGASTYALGKVMVQHFESGGTFLDFDPIEVREYFRKLFDEGRHVTAEAAASKGAKA